MFVDEATIKVVSGKGGDGCVSFLRTKSQPRGGPDGGDGANGGSVILKSDRNVIDYWEIARKRDYKAGKGMPGEAQTKNGLQGEDLYLLVPVGTVVRDQENGSIVFDFEKEGESFVAVKGGAGGRGNASYASSINQIPREFQYGKLGQEKELFLELRVIADVGLVGLPNAGKSTFLGSVTAARPKIANFPFTTLNPNLGVLEIRKYGRAVIADLPGLVEGSSEGRGLGIQFLKHIQRTRIILHLVDPIPDNDKKASENYFQILKELEGYDKSLKSKHHIVIVTKKDIDGAELFLEEFEEETGIKPLFISSLYKEGLEEVVKKIGETLNLLNE